MKLTTFAATYNCSDSANQAYGAGNYSTCDATAIGAPDTGFFAAVTSGAVGIMLPLVGVILLVILASLFVKRKKARQSSH